MFRNEWFEAGWIDLNWLVQLARQIFEMGVLYEDCLTDPVKRLEAMREKSNQANRPFFHGAQHQGVQIAVGNTNLHPHFSPMINRAIEAHVKECFRSIQWSQSRGRVKAEKRH